MKKMNIKKLIEAVGPVVCAFALVAGFFTFDIHIPMSKKERAFQATARNYSTVKGEYTRNQILADDKYIPFYSSSEMAIFDEFHPNMLAEKYNRPYVPYIAGRDAQGALTHFLEIKSTEDAHRGKKVVYLLSPNSFQIATGIPDQFYETVHSRQQISHWLLDTKKPAVSDEYAAKRLISYKVVQKDHLLAPKLKKIEAGNELTAMDDFKLGLKYRWLRSEDAFFSPVKNNRHKAKLIPEKDELHGMNNYQYAKKYKMPHLPDSYDIDELDKLAYDIGKKSSENNDFGFFDVKYTQDIGKNLKKFKNSRKDKTYTNSIEYSDFQLVLKEFAELDMEPYFIFMPIEQKWADYTGTPKSETEGVVKKLKYQLNSQGFNNFLVADGSKDYSYVDGVHAGRRAWVEVDQQLNAFLTAPKAKNTSYKIDNYFFSDDWAKVKVN